MEFGHREERVMAKAPKPNTARKPPVPSDSHVAIAEWSRRVMPDLHPIVKRLLRRLREHRLLRRRGIQASAAAWNHRTDPLRQGADPGGTAGTGDAQVDSASGPRAGLEMRVHEGRHATIRRRDRGIHGPCIRGHRIWVSL